MKATHHSPPAQRNNRILRMRVFGLIGCGTLLSALIWILLETAGADSRAEHQEQQEQQLHLQNASLATWLEQDLARLQAIASTTVQTSVRSLSHPAMMQNDFALLLTPLWKTLQDHIALLYIQDRSGPVLAFGEQISAVPREVQDAESASPSASFLHCAKSCQIVVSMPIVSGDEVVGRLAVGDNVDKIFDAFNQAFRTNVALLRIPMASLNHADHPQFMLTWDHFTVAASNAAITHDILRRAGAHTSLETALHEGVQVLDQSGGPIEVRLLPFPICDDAYACYSVFVHSGAASAMSASAGRVLVARFVFAAALLLTAGAWLLQLRIHRKTHRRLAARSPAIGDKAQPVQIETRTPSQSLLKPPTAESILNGLQAAVIAHRPDGRITYANQTAAAFYGVGHNLVSRRVENFIDFASSAQFEHLKLRQFAQSALPSMGQSGFLLAADGKRFAANFWHSRERCGSGDDLIVTLAIDLAVPTQLGALTDSIAAQDLTTGAANKSRFVADFNGAIRYCSRYQRSGALLVIDVNPSGPAPEPERARSVYAELRSMLRSTDLIAYLDNLRFAAGITEVGTREALHIAEKLLARLDALALSPGAPQSGAWRIAVAVFPQHGSEAESLLTCAQAWLDVAPIKNNVRIGLIEDAASPKPTPRLWPTYIQVERALRNDFFALHYQPVTDIASGQVSWYEGLLRWSDRRGQTLLPGDFLAAAQSAGLLKAIDEYVIRKAVVFLRDHGKRGAQTGLAINLSVASIAHPSLLDDVNEMLLSAGVAPHQLCIELPVSGETPNIDQLSDFVRHAKRLGFMCTADGFTASSYSLTLLRDLPFDFIKLDPSLCRCLATDPQARLLARLCCELAHLFGKKTIGHWVETAAVLAELEAIGVDMAQGYYLGKPQRMVA